MTAALQTGSERAAQSGPPVTAQTPPRTEEAPPRALPVRQLVMGAVAVLLALALAWWILEDPVAHVWYHTRQVQRAANWHQARKTTSTGQTLALLQIPSIGANLAVVQGDRVDLLRGGPGHEIGTPLPGAIGNSVIVGHRKGWGGPFAHLGQLQTGATIDVQLHAQSTVLLFTVSSVAKVGAHDRHLLAPSTDRRLTLVTSDGSRFSDGYLMVTAASGTAGTLGKANAKVTAAPNRGSPVLNKDIGLALLRGALAVAVVLLLRRRYRGSIVAVLASPLVLAALLSLTLGLDRTLPALG